MAIPRPLSALGSATVLRRCSCFERVSYSIFSRVFEFEGFTYFCVETIYPKSFLANFFWLFFTDLADASVHSKSSAPAAVPYPAACFSPWRGRELARAVRRTMFLRMGSMVVVVVARAAEVFEVIINKNQLFF